MRLLAGVIAVLLLVGAAGCSLTNSKQRKVQAATDADIRSMRDDVARLTRTVEALENEMTRSDKTFERELAELRRSVTALDGKVGRSVAGAKQELAAAINAVERKRVADRNALDAKMNAIVAQVNKALRSGGTRTTSGGTGTERGFVHTVKEGETVSAIAAKYRDEYGATVKAILDANNLTVNSIIRPGDDLFIPVKE